MEFLEGGDLVDYIQSIKFLNISKGKTFRGWG
jgi:hypothetical protein